MTRLVQLSTLDVTVVLSLTGLHEHVFYIHLKTCLEGLQYIFTYFFFFLFMFWNIIYLQAVQTGVVIIVTNNLYNQSGP